MTNVGMRLDGMNQHQVKIKAARYGKNSYHDVQSALQMHTFIRRQKKSIIIITKIYH